MGRRSFEPAPPPPIPHRELTPVDQRRCSAATQREAGNITANNHCWNAVFSDPVVSGVKQLRNHFQSKSLLRDAHRSIGNKNHRQIQPLGHFRNFVLHGTTIRIDDNADTRLVSSTTGPHSFELFPLDCADWDPERFLIRVAGSIPTFSKDFVDLIDAQICQRFAFFEFLPFNTGTTPSIRIAIHVGSESDHHWDNRQVRQRGSSRFLPSRDLLRWPPPVSPETIEQPATTLPPIG